MTLSNTGYVPERPRRPWLPVLIAMSALIILIGALYAWRASRSGQAGWNPGPMDVTAVTIKGESAPVTISALGELRSARQVVLPAESPGRVSAITFTSGAQVPAGAVLVQLDDAVEQADLTSAKAAVDFSRQQLARAKGLESSGAVSKEDLQQKQSEYDQARGLVQQIEARIKQKRIRAPFAGVLGLRKVDLGQYLTAGQDAVSLTDMGRLQVDFDVPQQELARLKIGQSVSINVDAHEPVVAAITAIEPQLGRDTRSATIQAEFQNTGSNLHPGMFATVNVELAAEANALIVPATAVMATASGDSAVVVREINKEGVGKAEFVQIRVARRLGDRVVIASGLKAGDSVVTSGQIRLQPGAPLKIIDEKSASAAPAQGEGKS